MVAMEFIVTMATERVNYISQYKVVAVSYLIIAIPGILRPRKLEFAVKMCPHLNSQFPDWLLGKIWQL